MLPPKPCSSVAPCHDVRHANPKYGPVRASKQDIKDGFYRLFLKALDCLRLAVILPKYDDEPQLIGIPMACTMGWVQSPPSFCTMSETICDLANQAFNASPKSAPVHRLEQHAASLDDLSRSTEPRPLTKEDHHANAALHTLATDLPGHQHGAAKPGGGRASLQLSFAASLGTD